MQTLGKLKIPADGANQGADGPKTALDALPAPKDHPFRPEIETGARHAPKRGHKRDHR